MAAGGGETLFSINIWWVRSPVFFSADQFAENHLENSGADVKRWRHVAQSGILMWDVEMDAGVPVPMETRRLQNLYLRHNTTVKSLLRGQGVHAKALRIRAYWSEIGRTLGCHACETPGPGMSHIRECKTFQDVWEESRRTATAVERWISVDPSSSSTDNPATARC